MNDRRVASELIEAIAAQDWGRLQACFAPEVQFRALIPPGVRERFGAAATAELIGAWFGDADPLELVDSQIDAVGDRVHVSYRFHAIEEGKSYLVEQHLYCVVGSDGIESVNLLCSGFRPAAVTAAT